MAMSTAFRGAGQGGMASRAPPQTRPKEQKKRKDDDDGKNLETLVGDWGVPYLHLLFDCWQKCRKRLSAFL